MIKPFKGNFPITQIFGVNAADYAKFGLKGHNGIDYGVPTGTPILAPHDGKVIEALYDQYGYGMYVKIESAVEGSVLAHLKSFNVNPGDVITEGTQIGISDNTGNSTGPHLHWGYYRIPRDRSNGYNGFIDQTPYLVKPPSTDYKALYEQSQIKINDLLATEKRLKDQKDELGKQMDNLRAKAKAIGITIQSSVDSLMKI